ncbi:Fur family transcriptional regulator [Thermococcus thioreducens]|uniref:Fur family transcriptional regulator n=1 Tax=Thermococcus thioreducens TaxID=277988 RepID=A0A0Q2S3K9_9EURY|nr:Fur family transcriptional regulator [Thermococcus thioreducens]ASJ12712.1 Fur family transcriptional regulator [Thermococcus thioreducens]KQH82043.1 Fur family transcriptional regulator [Thermococcus thioreducens]SEV86354.1 Fur family transcriptional regulator, peroxide stress response regulator [Thermococcus thioreducens]
MWKKKAIKRLKEHNYKLTPQRLKLVEILDRIGGEHPSLKEVLDEIREEFPTVSFSTLYSNVLTLKELGLLELFSLDGETRVELNTEPHINLISEGEVVDLNDPEIIERIREKIGRDVKLVNVLVK